jgi:transposase
MSNSTIFKIKESELEIKKLINKNTRIVSKRLQALLVFKRHEHEGISKRVVADEIGVNHNSVQTWRGLYIKGGIKKLMSHNNIGYKPSKINAQQQDVLKNILHNPENGFVGYIELQTWFNETYKTDIEYNTFRGFIVRKFKSKIKVARKYHAKKDQEAVDTFKKTSIKYVKKSLKKKAKDTKK